MSYGIGTLNEKSVHAWLKLYLEPDHSRHEVKIGNFVADIAYIEDKQVIEIQTGCFNKLLRKIMYYTEIGYNISVVYPVSVVNTIHWINPDNGEEEQVRKRRIPGGKYRVFKELYRLRDFLKNANLRFRLIELETDDYRYLDGFGRSSKKRATKIDKVPYNILNEYEFSVLSGYEQFIPEELSKLDSFTTKDICKYIKCSRDIVSIMALILYEVGVLRRVGKYRNSYLYTVSKDN